MNSYTQHKSYLAKMGNLQCVLELFRLFTRHLHGQLLLLEILCKSSAGSHIFSRRALDKHIASKCSVRLH